MPVEVMLDLETLGNGSNAAVVQIGACTFEPESNDKTGMPGGHAAYARNILFGSAMEHGVADGGTLRWWFKQSEDARLGLFEDPVDLPLALSEFSKWWDTLGGVGGLWSHATFDVVILRSAYEACGLRVPWNYRQVRDLRTLHYLHWPGKIERGGILHNALDDALFQAELATISIRKLKGLGDGD